MKTVVAGGAGFIGSFITDELIARGHEVVVYDDLLEQVHGTSGKAPEYLNPAAALVKGNVLEADKFYEAVKDAEVLFYEAAAVGVGQSMYQIKHYVEQNALGAGVALDVIVNRPNKLKKMIVASSMSVYGEGAYTCGKCGEVYPGLRTRKQLEKKDWRMECPECGGEALPSPAGEKKPLDPTSIYAVTKRDHEESFLAVGRAYGIPVAALRYFNVYGPRQALSNPYTGVCAIFSSRLLNGQRPVIFEDGLQSRDFIHVKDIAAANMLAMEKSEADYRVFNVGTGMPKTILDVARILSAKLRPGEDIQPEVTNNFREGDIRHCFSDSTKIRELLGFEPTIKFEDGIDDLTAWVSKQIAEDRSAQALQELRRKGLTD